MSLYECMCRCDSGGDCECLCTSVCVDVTLEVTECICTSVCVDVTLEVTASVSVRVCCVDVTLEVTANVSVRVCCVGVTLEVTASVSVRPSQRSPLSVTVTASTPNGETNTSVVRHNISSASADTDRQQLACSANIHGPKDFLRCS